MLLLIGNIIIPGIASLLCFIFFFYFVVVDQREPVNAKRFAVFLLSFGVFLISRPLQILLGPYPIPLIINDLRLLIFCTITVPMVLILTDKTEDNLQIQKIRIIISVGFLFGLVYTVFNILGTKGSYEIFRFGNIIAYDNLSPSHVRPFYGREVTISVTVLMGIVLSGSVGYRIYANRHLKTKEQTKKALYYNLGILIFGLSLILGSIVKKWWIYYSFSLPSVVLLGYGVMLDIKEIRLKVEGTITLIRDILIKDLTLNTRIKDEISEMLMFLGKNNHMDTFCIIKITKQENNPTSMIYAYQDVVQLATHILNQQLGKNTYLIIQMDVKQIGICLSGKQRLYDNKEFLISLAENIREQVAKKTRYVVTIGIGRSYNRIEELWLSYHEALQALEYAEKNDVDNQVIQIDALKYKTPKNSYPSKLKAQLLSAVRFGDTGGLDDILTNFYRDLYTFSKYDLEVMKVRLFELLGALIDTAITAGGDEDKLFNLSKDCFKHINETEDINLLKQRLFPVLKTIVMTVRQSHTDRSERIINRAKEYIEKNYSEHLTVEDIARTVFISPSYFKHLFKKISGYSFKDYLSRIRLDKAKELLLNSDMSITNIAYEVGYQDSNYFSTLFKKAEGVTPSEYRSTTFIGERI
ncbi:MAG: helix-turn-helix domain-containing protein [Spirochaetales bacterium]|nr:helix-turn-helix domain-containing protein [Spirochaetales bacterium]